MICYGLKFVFNVNSHALLAQILSYFSRPVLRRKLGPVSFVGAFLKLIQVQFLEIYTLYNQNNSACQRILPAGYADYTPRQGLNRVRRSGLSS